MRQVHLGHEANDIAAAELFSPGCLLGLLQEATCKVKILNTLQEVHKSLCSETLLTQKL
jgi:hypothetical protein